VGTLYSSSWSEYSLSDSYSGRPEVPSPGSREVISVLLCPERSLMSFLYLGSLFGWPFLNSCLPSQFTYTGFQLRGGFTISLPHILLLVMQEEPECSTQHASGASFSSDQARKRPISSDIPDTQDCPIGIRRCRDFLESFGAKKTLCRQLVYPYPVNTLLPSCWNMMLGHLESPSSTWPMYTGHPLDLWRPDHHQDHCR